MLSTKSDKPLVQVAAVVLRDEAGRVATVRKQTSPRFQFPGGKPEAAESDLQAAVRECQEEIGLSLDPASLRLLGIFTAPASNEAGFDCRETLFESPLTIGAGQVLSPHAEIAEIRWQDINLGESDQVKIAAPTVGNLATADPAQGSPVKAESAGDLDSASLAPLLRLILPTLPSRHSIHALTFFTGSAQGQQPVYAQAVTELAQACATCGIDVVYGGGKVGLMGQLADSALAAGGHVIGVMPKLLVDGEIAHQGLTRLEVVADMDERKARLNQLSDAIVALPGGSGTLEEFFEAWTWQQLGIHHKPVALYNAGGFWDPLLTMIDSMVAAGFLSQAYADSLIVADNPADLIDSITAWTPPATKWHK